MSVTLKLEEAIRLEAASNAASEQLSLKYSQDLIFRSWADLLYGEGKVIKISRQQNDTLSKKIMDDYILAQKNRENEIHLQIMNTKVTAPNFYEKYKKLIDDMNPKKTDTTLFMPFSREVLDRQ